MKILALGPEGTNGHQAAIIVDQLLGGNCDISFGESHWSHFSQWD